MSVLAFDTSTADTVVGLQLPGGAARTARHTPRPGERPGHSAQLLPLARGLLAAAGLSWRELTRIGVGLGPGTFTGLRIGVSTARALVQAGGQELVGLSSLAALAIPAALLPRSESPAARTNVLACGDARRGELWIDAWRGGASLLDGPRALAPEALAPLLAAHAGPWRAVGDGAVRYRTAVEVAGAEVPPDDSPLHHLDGAALCALALLASPRTRDALEPVYVRAPDAVPTHLR